MLNPESVIECNSLVVVILSWDLFSENEREDILLWAKDICKEGYEEAEIFQQNISMEMKDQFINYCYMLSMNQMERLWWKVSPLLFGKQQKFVIFK